MMKKLTALALLLTMLSLPLLGLMVGEPLMRFDSLPESMQRFQPEGYQFMDGIKVEGKTAYLLFHNGSSYYLYVIRQDDKDVWQLVVRSNQALPRGSVKYTLKGDMPNKVYVSQSEDLLYIFKEEKAVWKLAGYFKATADSELAISFQDDKIVYENIITGSRTTVHGVYQRQLQHLNIDAIPMTAKAARASLSQPPKLPAGGLQAKKVKFTGGQKYPVYTGPGEHYLRAANGKALVSTNDWVQVFGTESGWALIQYDLSSSQMRIGFISASALPKNAGVGSLALADLKYEVQAPAALTDDPLFSQGALLSLSIGQQVSYLSSLGTWAYVELLQGSQPVRGFVPAASLRPVVEAPALPQGNLYNVSAAFAGYEATAAVNLSADGKQYEILVYARVPEAWLIKTPGSDYLLGYRLYENNKPGAFSVASENFNGHAVFLLQVPVNQEVQVLGLAPEFAISGVKASDMLIITK